MLRLATATLGLAAASLPAIAQGSTAQPRVECSIPDSVAVRGNTRISAVTIRTDAGLSSGMQLDVPTIQRAIRGVFNSGNFDDVDIGCEAGAEGKQVLVIAVTERPILMSYEVRGTDALSARTVRDRVTLAVGRPLDPAAIAKSVQAIDSLYEDRGYYLAEIRPETTIVAGSATIDFRIEEGRRLAISGIDVTGNKAASDAALVGAMKTSPEGLWFWQNGTFDDDVYRADLSLALPAFYAKRGFIDFTVVRDSLVVDPELGKAQVQLQVDEGPQYRVGTFEIVGNRHFSNDELRQFYPFGGQGPSLGQRVTSVIRRQEILEGVFDRTMWQGAIEQVQNAYMNEGYLSVQVRPVVERTLQGPDSIPTANLRWEIAEGPISIVNRVDIQGNDYTTELCIRDQLSIFPGSVFNRDRLFRSYQQIANLGFFETPIPSPEVKEAGDQGDVDIIFNLTEKRTGNVNFGASVGQGVGVGGFIGLDQPNLFGQCKRGSLQWQFGGLINDFNLSYTDPAIQRSNYSGKVDAYHTRSRYLIRDFGRQIRTGGAIRVGFPLGGSIYSRMFVSYGGEAVRYGRDEGSLLGTLRAECDNCFRSTLGTTMTRDTRLGLPFATAGSLQSLDAQFNGGPLGGTAKFQRYTTELRSYAPLGRLGGEGLGAAGVEFTLGLTVRAGTVFGNTGPFFPFQEFAMGGTQQGEQLRGYDEFTITPRGYVPEGSSLQATRASFGRSFLSTTAEFGARVSQQFYASLFYDAGNVWDHPREIDPTRLFRGAGVGVALITPLGPLGLDWAYGFDRLNAQGRPDPRWKLHFKLGQLF
jgi:outer membrane protein insertion porin family